MMFSHNLCVLYLLLIFSVDSFFHKLNNLNRKFTNGKCLLCVKDVHSANSDLFIPKHVAFIVDGNGRWAISHNMSRLDGHNFGANVTVEVVKRSFEIGY